jgi:hypothetical protein
MQIYLIYTLRNLYLKAKRIHRSLPNAYSDDLHLRDFLLRACCAEPFCSKIPEETSKSSSDAHAQLSAAITRYAAYKSRTIRARQMGKFPRRSLVERESKSGIHYAETRSVSSKAVTDESEKHYMTKPSSSLQGKKENRLDRTGKQMLCHHCSSKFHLLSACPTAPAEKKINVCPFSKLVTTRKNCMSQIVKQKYASLGHGMV